MTTLDLLRAEYNAAFIPLDLIAKKYLGLDHRQALDCARRHRLPFPALRLGGQKSPWLVDIRELARWLERTVRRTVR